MSDAGKRLIAAAKEARAMSIDTSAAAIAIDLGYLRSRVGKEWRAPEAVIHDRYKALAAERDKLRETLERISNHYDDTQLAAKHMSAIARAALKETDQ